MAESIIESKIYAKYRKNCDDSRSEAEATAKVSGTTPHKKRFAEIYSDDYLERLRRLKEYKDKDPLPPYIL